MSSILKTDSISSLLENGTITVPSDVTLVCDNLKSSDGTYHIKSGDIQYSSPTPGMTIGRVFRMVTNDYTYATGGGYNQNYAHLAIMNTTITLKEDNSLVYGRFGINGEPGSTHNWTMFPVVSFDLGTTWNKDYPGMRHSWDSTINDTTYSEYVRGYTNPGNYPDADYSSTPIQTATMDFMIKPNLYAGDTVTFSVYMMSTGNHTWYLNRSVSNSMGGYERGVSYCMVEEISTQENDNNVSYTVDSDGNITIQVS